MACHSLLLPALCYTPGCQTSTGAATGAAAASNSTLLTAKQNIRWHWRSQCTGSDGTRDVIVLRRRAHRMWASCVMWPAIPILICQLVIYMEAAFRARGGGWCMRTVYNKYRPERTAKRHQRTEKNKKGKERKRGKRGRELRRRREGSSVMERP